jgi:hypothetical protein
VRAAGMSLSTGRTAYSAVGSSLHVQLQAGGGQGDAGCCCPCCCLCYLGRAASCLGIRILVCRGKPQTNTPAVQTTWRRQVWQLTRSTNLLEQPSGCRRSYASSI